MRRVAAILILVGSIGSWSAAATREQARHLYRTGRYDEAVEQYDELAAMSPPEAVLGAARSLAAIGKYGEAEQRLRRVLDPWPENAILQAELALLAWRQGRAEDAAKRAEAALALDENQLVARWVRAELLRTSGKLDEAGAAYRWFVDYQKAHHRDITSAEDMVWIGRAAAQYARWNRLSDQFRVLVNSTFPGALRLEADYWPAHLEVARLLLEKYNQAGAAESLAGAAKINPHAPDVLATQAELALLDFELAKAERLLARALRINPRHVESLVALADVHFARLDPAAALSVLDDAAAVNPVDERVLGRIVAALELIDSADGESSKGETPAARAKRVMAEVTARNPHAGEFYDSLATGMELSRKYPDAARYLERAIELMPQLVAARGRLGLMQMRLADEAAARRTLDAAFEIDPFNVRVHNSLEVLDVLNEYETLDTEHFQIRYDPAHDDVLARCAAAYLEEIYPEMCQQLEYELPQPGLIEIFNHAKNTNGQGWFSARIVGLPNVHLVAACTGRMVAVTSPAAIRRRIDWARILRHELVHLFNLEQTNFNVPHWFTEAVAVRLEDAPRRPEWYEMLVRRIEQGAVFNLDTINGVFVHPGSSENWQMAYCQADLYADYLLATYGDDALQKMLAAYRETRSTRRVLKECFDIEQEDFEQGFAEHLKNLAETWRAEGVRANRSLGQLRRAHERNPNEAATATELAAAQVERKQFAAARELVDAVLASDPQHAGATAVKAELLLAVGETAAARKLLDDVHDDDAPDARVVRLLARVALEDGDSEAAERLFSLGAERWPRDPAWTKSLTVIALRNGDRDKLPSLLARLAENDYRDATVRQRLSQLAAADADFATAARWAEEAIHLNVRDAAMHRLLGRCLLQLGDAKRAEFYAAIADELEGGKP